MGSKLLAYGFKASCQSIETSPGVTCGEGYQDTAGSASVDTVLCNAEISSSWNRADETQKVQARQR